MKSLTNGFVLECARTAGSPPEYRLAVACVGFTGGGWTADNRHRAVAHSFLAGYFAVAESVPHRPGSARGYDGAGVVFVHGRGILEYQQQAALLPMRLDRVDLVWGRIGCSCIVAISGGRRAHDDQLCPGIERSDFLRRIDSVWSGFSGSGAAWAGVFPADRNTGDRARARSDSGCIQH